MTVTIEPKITKEIHCDKCGESCMHEGANYIGFSFNTRGVPTSLSGKMPHDTLSVCYPCFYKVVMNPD